jgi:hypothetical protein
MIQNPTLHFTGNAWDASGVPSRAVDLARFFGTKPASPWRRPAKHAESGVEIAQPRPHDIARGGEIGYPALVR